MTKNDFLTRLSAELAKNKVEDAADILCEYEQHFSFKMADGFSEKEICERLGSPAQLAAQFEAGTKPKTTRGKKIPTFIGLGFADLFAGIFFLLLVLWEAVMAVFSLTCAALSVCLIGGFNINGWIPPMPYWCGAVFALTCAALAVLSACGTSYFAAFLRQLMRSFGRFQHNAIAAASGHALLPSLTVAPQFTPKAKRRLRTVTLISLALFAACFILGMIVAMLSAGALSFWHAWGWFGYTA